MGRQYWIPTTTALGLGLSSCSATSLSGDWTVTAFVGIVLPLESNGDLFYSASGTLSIDDALTAKLQVEFYYYVNYYGKSYQETYTYAHTGAISKTGKRQYSIQLEGDDRDELNLECALRGSDMLDCDEGLGEDGATVFVFERD